MQVDVESCNQQSVTCVWVACRNKYGEYFGITVAGYPEAHPDAIVSDPAEMDKIYWSDLHYLKEKVGALSMSACCKLKGMRTRGSLPCNGQALPCHQTAACASHKTRQ